jgi:hypothetical protein
MCLLGIHYAFSGEMSTEILSDLKNILSWALRRLKQKD